jgi:hypothetical protein
MQFSNPNQGKHSAGLANDCAKSARERLLIRVRLVADRITNRVRKVVLDAERKQLESQPCSDRVARE